MKHLKKYQLWGCMATSFAMAYDMTLDEFYQSVGHDGSEIVYPELPEPMRRRGVHPNECVLVGLQNGCAVTPFEVHSQLQASQDINALLDIGISRFHRKYARKTVEQSKTALKNILQSTIQEICTPLDSNWLDFKYFICRRRGVLEGWAGKCKHAVAFDRGTIYDPDGPQYPYDRAECERRGFFGNRLWIVDKVAQN
jgi:hypothetical protein